MFEEVALNMPYVFLVLYGVMAVLMPRFRWVGIIVASSALFNILLSGHFDTIDDALPYGLLVILYSSIDYATAALMLGARDITIKGYYFGSEGAEMQALALTFFIFFNGIMFADYNWNDFRIYSTYIPMIFILNLIQLTFMGRSIYASARRDAPSLGRRPLGYGLWRSHVGHYGSEPSLTDKEAS